MAKSTITRKIAAADALVGEEGERLLATGDAVAMRLWQDEAPRSDKPRVRHDYETAGYVIRGRAELEIEGESTTLEPGDSYLVPRGAMHTFRILETLTAVEAIAPPPRGHSGR